MAFSGGEPEQPAPSEDFEASAPLSPDARGGDAPPEASSASLRRGPNLRGDEPHGGSAFDVSDGAITWRCRVCDTINPLDAPECRVCGAPLAETLRPPEPRGPIGDPGTAALLSLFVPGAGHAYLGLWGQAAARAVTAAWVAAVAVVAAAGQGFTAPMAILFTLVSFTLWGVTAHDAYRESLRDRTSVLLEGRSFLWVVVGLLLLSIVMLIVSALGARPG